MSGGTTGSGGMFGGMSRREIERKLGFDTTRRATTAVARAVGQAKTITSTSEIVSRSLREPITPIIEKFLKDREHLEKLLQAVTSQSAQQVVDYVQQIEATKSDISKVFDSSIFERTASDPPQFRIAPLADWEWEQDLEEPEPTEVHVFVLGAMYEFYICAIGSQGEPDQATKAKFEAVEEFLSKQADLIADEAPEGEGDTGGGDEGQTA